MKELLLTISIVSASWFSCFAQESNPSRDVESGYLGKVIAVADENSNFLIVSAPDGLMEKVTDLVEKLDAMPTASTLLRAFPLHYADPTETADLLNSVFGENDSTSASHDVWDGTSQTQVKKNERLTAVADPRTATVLVSGPAGLITQAANLVETLDKNPAKKQRVFVFNLENADVETTESALKTLFQTSTDTTTGSSQDASLLDTRNQQLQQNTSQMGSPPTSGGSSMGE